MMTDRYYSLEERFISCIDLFGDTWSGPIAVVETFASGNIYLSICLSLIVP